MFIVTTAAKRFVVFIFTLLFLLSSVCVSCNSIVLCYSFLFFAWMLDMSIIFNKPTNHLSVHPSLLIVTMTFPLSIFFIFFVFFFVNFFVVVGVRLFLVHFADNSASLKIFQIKFYSASPLIFLTHTHTHTHAQTHTCRRLYFIHL